MAHVAFLPVVDLLVDWIFSAEFPTLIGRCYFSRMDLCLLIARANQDAADQPAELPASNPAGKKRASSTTGFRVIKSEIF